jgi:hypothetical protein
VASAGPNDETPNGPFEADLFHDLVPVLSKGAAHIGEWFTLPKENFEQLTGGHFLQFQRCLDESERAEIASDVEAAHGGSGLQGSGEGGGVPKNPQQKFVAGRGFAIKGIVP